ncbi:MAG: hypothetical protein AAFO58_03010 [Pseudomonadota bacterium]
MGVPKYAAECLATVVISQRQSVGRRESGQRILKKVIGLRPSPAIHEITCKNEQVRIPIGGVDPINRRFQTPQIFWELLIAAWFVDMNVAQNNQFHNGRRK